MKTVIRTSLYEKWFRKIRDNEAKIRIFLRIKRLVEGNFGDVAPIGEGCSELRIHYGPGYRVYFKDTGREIVILLCGGDKSSQQADIAKAKKLAKLLVTEG